MPECVREPTAVITCSILHLQARCDERGYTLDEVRPCIVSQDGDRIVVDETHPSYPKPKVQGPGTELTKLIASMGLTPAPGCQCKKRARYMDKMGCDWCEQNLDKIVGWLKEEHGRSKMLLPFSALAAKQVVKLAIRRAKRGNSQ